ncbi:MAG: carboxypeptidase-like regulatory domain-containing protein, partial [bacterium]|nr:carboxypeptidase-like regulatory domain-containing protein [bacterium]
MLPEYVSAQVIKGEVVDKNGIRIQGVHILGTDSKSSTTTNIGGNFTINAQVGERLTITMLGFDAISVKAISGSMIIVMKESQETELQEIIVIGYGNRKKTDNTGAISQLTAGD